MTKQEGNAQKKKIREKAMSW